MVVDRGQPILIVLVGVRNDGLAHEDSASTIKTTRSFVPVLPRTRHATGSCRAPTGCAIFVADVLQADVSGTTYLGRLLTMYSAAIVLAALPAYPHRAYDVPFRATTSDETR